jgi:FkbM family methyltransferase
MEMLINLLCFFVPNKKWRKKIRYKMRGIKREQRRRIEILDYGCKIEKEIVTMPEGVKIDISNMPLETMGIIGEIFLKKNYSICLGYDIVLIDIGLNRGIASLYFATYPNTQKIYSFEPFKPTFGLAKKNMELNPELSRKINSYNFGLGNEERTLELEYVDTVAGSMSTTYEVCKGEKNAKKETVIIKDAAKEISFILEEHKDKYIIVKCDCEGAEFEIFERLNNKNIINRIDAIIMEYHFEKPDRIIDILIANGFIVRKTDSSGKAKTGYIYAVKMAKKNIEDHTGEKKI